MSKVAPRLPWFGHGKFPLYLAPMARHTDVAFRQLCKEQGADVMVTEFVQSEALIRDNAKAWEMVDFTEGQRPMGVQIFGATPASMAKAARLVCERMKPDFLDLNFGCPAHKVIEQNAGSGLLRCTPLLYDLVKAVKDAIPDVPLTAKMRLGWDHSTIVAVEVAGRLQSLGVEAIAVHGRTKEQGYSGEAHWGWIAQVAAAVDIPVIGNGDVKDGASALLRQRESGVSGLMIGRAALGNQWIFAQIKAALEGRGGGGLRNGRAGPLGLHDPLGRAHDRGACFAAGPSRRPLDARSSPSAHAWAARFAQTPRPAPSLPEPGRLASPAGRTPRRSGAVN